MSLYGVEAHLKLNHEKKKLVLNSFDIALRCPKVVAEVGSHFDVVPADPEQWSKVGFRLASAFP